MQSLVSAIILTVAAMRILITEQQTMARTRLLLRLAMPLLWLVSS